MSAEQRSPDLRKWERRKNARPSEIMGAALELFVERGFAATKMEDIARRAGVTKGTPYLYFSNKEELFKEAVRHSLIAHLSAVEAFSRDFSGSTPQLFIETMRLWWQWVGESNSSGIPKLMVAEAGNFPDLARFYAEEVILRGNNLVRAILQRGIERGEFRPLNLDYVVNLVVAPVLYAMLWKHSFGNCGLPQFDMEVYFRECTDLLLHGLLQKDNHA